MKYSLILYFFLDSWDGFLIFDISDPLNPELIRFYKEVVNDNEPGMVDGISTHPLYDDIIILGKSSVIII